MTRLSYLCSHQSLNVGCLGRGVTFERQFQKQLTGESHLLTMLPTSRTQILH